MLGHSSFIRQKIQTALQSCFPRENVVRTELIQNLWDNYGQLVRITTNTQRPLMVKVVHLSAEHDQHQAHTISHQRKIKSYHIENTWYKNWSKRCHANCRVPKVWWAEQDASGSVLILEDMDASGYPERAHRLSAKQLESCLRWLANFHAIYLGESPQGLWATGTYWHLETRQDELKAMGHSALRKAAPWIDVQLKQARYQTFVHGDAKVANFCFAEKGDDCCAVDFQYVGLGCGMKDLVYLFGSCRSESECEQNEAQHLDLYFKYLRQACAKYSTCDVVALEQEWRGLYDLAWTDFYRFMLGWGPGYCRNSAYSEKIAKRVLAKVRC